MEILSISLSALSFLICLFLLFKKRNTNESLDLSNEKYSEICYESKCPLQLSITNDTSEVKECVIFGCGQFLLSNNFGSSEGLEVTPSQYNVSYLLFLLQSAFKPFKTNLIRMQSKNINQLKSIITVISTDANGQSCTVPIITQNYYNENQKIKEINDIETDILIDSSTFLKINVLPNTSFNITFFVSKKVDISRILRQNLSKVKNNFNNLIKK